MRDTGARRPPGDPPDPGGARTMDELVACLRALRGWAGLSEREVHRRVSRARAARGIPEVPSYDTVHRCFQQGRARLNVDLVEDIARALVGNEAAAGRWRGAHARIVGAVAGSGVVTVADAPPADLPAFSGRRDALRALLGGGGSPAGLRVIEGMAGVGKTALAARAAHLLRRQGGFEATLWVDLNGYAPDLPPADPLAVLDASLRRLGMSADRVRLLTPQARAREFHRRLAGRRVLLVLDNAGDEEQVRPLLPEGPGCLTLVTSRRSLPGLPGALRLRLDVFSPGEAMELLRRTAGADRVDTDPGTAARIAESVGHLPLALGVVAGRIGGRFGWTLADHLEQLLGHRDRLRSEDSVELALRLSYESLAPGCRRLFRVLALGPRPDLDVYAAAALADDDPAGVRARLETLLAANLLREPVPGRYAFHDLVRIYATAQAHEHDPAHARRAALARLLDHDRHAASLAMDHFAPYERHHRPPPGTPGTVLPPLLTDRRSATAWLDAERAGLVATALHAAEHGRPDHTGKMSAILFRYLDVGGHYQEAEALHTRADLTPDPHDRAQALARLGAVRWRVGRDLDAIEDFQQALAAFRSVGDRVGEGWVLGNTGEVLQHVGRLSEAREHFGQALGIARQLRARREEDGKLGDRGVMYEPLGRYPKQFTHPREALEMGREILGIARRIGDRVSEGQVLGSLGSILRQDGRPAQALNHLRQALTIARGIGHHVAEVALLNELGATLRALPGDGRWARAARYYREAAARAGELGDRYEGARAHEGLGHCRSAAGDAPGARAAWRRAHALFAELGTPEAEAVARRLASLDAADVPLPEYRDEPG
ncbi:tetratricopeptide repeat protein [Streptomyces sp. MP131-18]|uniref:tetratricopeptide repeat protein n=1 Tax=Streptomyces sp. MP131-18 TaxID=1857892 RepID=UPI00097C5CCF|nr:tetratricopeptide repeat protein [Streptomyces sp. MP131-18]ONK11093.1 Regulatory protein AfsR [Streptomyces sp. MP131-18]